MCRGRHKTLIPNYTSAMDDLRCWPNAWAHHRVAADREGLIRPAPLPVGGGMVGAHPRITGADPDARVLKPRRLRRSPRAVGRGVMDLSSGDGVCPRLGGQVTDAVDVLDDAARQRALALLIA